MEEMVLLDRLRADPSILEEAQDAFWAVIAKRFPEITTGDLDPGTTFVFDGACLTVVEAWIWGNTPTD